jgi:hypothetical protein
MVNRNDRLGPCQRRTENVPGTKLKLTDCLYDAMAANSTKVKANHGSSFKDFDYVRVDLYAPDNEVYFGELTFTPGAGVLPFAPDKVDYEWGRLLTSTPG